jgi:hypothetical protein
MLNCRTWITVISLICVLYACKKGNKNDNHATGKRLVKMINRGRDSSAYTFYTYDAKGRLSYIVDSASANRYKVSYTYQYNEKDQLTVILAKNRDYPYFTKDSFVYNPQQQICQRYHDAGYGVYMLRNSLSYDDRGRLVADTSYYDLSGSITRELVEFTYDNVDNVIKEQSSYPWPNSTYSYTFTAVYNWDKNPFQSQSIVNYLSHYGESTQFGKNNMVLLKDRFGDVRKYTYTYRDGLLTSVRETIKDSRGEDFYHDTDYFYE